MRNKEEIEFIFALEAYNLINNPLLKDKLCWLKSLQTRFILIDFANIVRNFSFLKGLCMSMCRCTASLSTADKVDPFEHLGQTIQFDRDGKLSNQCFDYFITKIKNLLESLHFTTKYHFVIVVQDNTLKFSTENNITVIHTECKTPNKTTDCFKVFGRDPTDDYILLLIYYELCQSKGSYPGQRVYIFSRDYYTTPLLNLKRYFCLDFDVQHVILVIYQDKAQFVKISKFPRELCYIQDFYTKRLLAFDDRV